jgi:S1-C subfamily serine protease
MGKMLVENRLQIWALVLALILCATHYAQYRKPKIDIESKLDSVVIVKTPSGSGTGFFFGKEGCMMTAFHVISKDNKAEKVTFLLRGDPRIYNATVVAGNADLDMAVICSSEAWRPGLRIVQTENVQQGEHVWVMGHPQGRNWNVTDGVVSRFGFKMHARQIRIDSGFLKVAVPVWTPRYDMIVSAFISWGNSGGPVLDDNGDVVGMIVEWDNVGQGHPSNINVAVPGTDLLRFIRSSWGK